MTSISTKIDKQVLHLSHVCMCMCQLIQYISESHLIRLLLDEAARIEIGFLLYNNNDNNGVRIHLRLFLLAKYSACIQDAKA